jgi:hypothetical protein
MNELTEHNIIQIYENLKDRGMTVNFLIDEMVDHICCEIEKQMNQGIPFQVAYSKLMNELPYKTFQTIQHQTLLSINLKFQDMKKSMFSLGVLGTILLIVGVILKNHHIAGAGINLVIGTVLIVFGFLPLFFFITYKEQTDKKSVLLSLVGYLTASILLVGSLFRIMHWPGTHKIMIAGQLLLIVVFLPVYIVNVFKKANETRTNFVYIIIIVGIAIATVFMATSTRVSKSFMDKCDAIYKNNVQITNMFIAKNESLFSNFVPDSNSLINKQNLDKLKNSYSELNKQITNLNIEIIKLADGQSATLECFNSKDDQNAFGEIMIERGNGNILKENFSKFKELLLSLSKDEFQRQEISAYLNVELLNVDPMIVNIHELKNLSMIEGIALLSEVQKNIQIAEYQILKGSIK